MLFAGESESQELQTASAGSDDMAGTGAQQAYELRELVLESLLDLCRLPWFFTELFVNFDCKPEVRA